MNAALWKKSIRESKWLLFFLALGVFAFCWLRVWLVGRVEMSRFAAIIGQLWDEIENFSTVPLSHLLTYPGRIAVVFNEPIVVLSMTVWTIARGSDAVSGEIGRGTMEMLLAQPVGRLQVLVSKTVVGVAGAAVLCGSAWLGTAVGISLVTVKETPPPASFQIPGLKIDVPLPWGEQPEPVRAPMSDKVSPNTFLPALGNLFCLGFFLLGFTTLLSSWDRQRWRTIGVACAAWVVMMVVKAVGMAVDEVAWLQYFSFFTPYSPEWAVYVGANFPEAAWRLGMAEESGRQIATPLTHNVVLLAMGAACCVAAGCIFNRRDLPAPL